MYLCPKCFTWNVNTSCREPECNAIFTIEDYRGDLYPECVSAGDPDHRCEGPLSVYPTTHTRQPVVRCERHYMLLLRELDKIGLAYR